MADPNADSSKAAAAVAEDAPSWDVRVLARIDAGVDGSLIEANLRRTPTERLRRMQEMLCFLEEARRDGRPADP
jgi:hypothetical protein